MSMYIYPFHISATIYTKISTGSQRWRGNAAPWFSSAERIQAIASMFGAGITTQSNVIFAKSFEPKQLIMCRREIACVG